LATPESTETGVQWSDVVLKLFDRRFVIFTGKGGVGKTTLASAFALSCAMRGERTLLMELNVKDKVSSMFGSDQIGSEIVEIEDCLYAVNATPAAAIEEYALMILRLRVIYKAVFENRIIQTFLRAVPGLNELVMLGKAYFHAVETHDDGTHVWDKIVVDAPATGHGIFFFQIPQVITSLISSGHMYDEAIRILELIQDPERTALNLVTLAEEMPINECLMLRDAATNKLGMPLGYVIANGILDEAFKEGDGALVDTLEKAQISDTRLRGLLDAARYRQVRAELQRQHLETLEDKIGLPLLTITDKMGGRMDFQGIKRIADELTAQLERGAP
jgi:energy-coupling factor transporter ATP-binding protein EcfA2